jgi:hypothetical protein
MTRPETLSRNGESTEGNMREASMAINPLDVAAIIAPRIVVGVRRRESVAMLVSGECG